MSHSGVMEQSCTAVTSSDSMGAGIVIVPLVSPGTMVLLLLPLGVVSNNEVFTDDACGGMFVCTVPYSWRIISPPSS